jgi:hypothetical protein
LPEEFIDQQRKKTDEKGVSDDVKGKNVGKDGLQKLLLNN